MHDASAFPSPRKQELLAISLAFECSEEGRRRGAKDHILELLVSSFQMSCSGLFAFFLSLLFRCLLAAQQQNTDAYLVSEFFQSMGGVLPPSSSGDQVCSWKMVACDPQMEKVISLEASGIGLSGPIPSGTIGKLTKLQFLDLSGNHITSFSSDFWELGGSLRHLNLSYNRINGPLPSNIGNFGKMENLDLSHNNLSGEIPVALGSLSALRALNLSGNSFVGSIPSAIHGCKYLVSMSLSGNMLNGVVPGDLGTGFDNLTFLDLSDNAIGGGLPDLSGLKSIAYLNLSGNMLQGSVLVLGVFRNPLEVVDLSKNQFQGHISQVNLSSNSSWSTLLYLDLSMNELSGEFFPDLGGARLLKHLNLAFNRFAHQEFPKIGMLSELEYLNLSKTGITGQISSDISQLVSLKTLDLSQNHLNGSIPALSSGVLQVIDLSVNNLTGEIPQWLQKSLMNMEKFNFSYNNLTLCAAKFSRQVLNSAFVGSQNDCPIAANPEIIQTRRPKHKSLKLTIAIVISVFCLVTGLMCLLIGCRRRNRSWADKQMSYKEDQSISGPFSFQTDSTTWVADVKLATSVPVVIFEKPLLNFTFADLLAATSHFDRGTLLAEGRFGPVYRGFLPGGIHVAVKVLVHASTVTDQEAARELERLGRIKHPNLVPLTGYCLAGDQRIAIYEYMENGNLQNLLHDLPLGVQTTEDWSTDTWEEDNPGAQGITTEGMTTWRFRHKIALGAARALAFLHHGCFPQIVHRDVKASSIYLDSGLEPRLSDFGLSTITSMDDEISRGSQGYAPPEFSEFEKALATTKSDVYGFGVVLFELITGKKPIGDEYPEEKEATLVNWARALVKRNEGSLLIDPKIRETAPPKQMEEALRVAYLCTADAPSKRPSMQQIVGLLKDIEPAPTDH